MEHISVTLMNILIAVNLSLYGLVLNIAYKNANPDEITKIIKDIKETIRLFDFEPPYGQSLVVKGKKERMRSLARAFQEPFLQKRSPRFVSRLWTKR